MNQLRLLIRSRIVLPFLLRLYWPIAVRYRWFAAVYYAFFDKSFWGEFEAALAGKLRFYQRNAHETQNPYLLRRNVHRLEKGLMMQPRRAVFATSYIGQTVDGYKRCAKDDTPLAGWASDVLTEYFEVTERVTGTEVARRSFRPFAGTPKAVTPKGPYLLKKRSSVDIETFRQLAQDRRSVRWYVDTPVPRELVEQAIEIALLSPSACNRQPFKFFGFDDSKKRNAIASIPAGTSGFSDNIPYLIAVVGELDAFALERDRHLIYIDGALAAMSLMFALETLGLSSCPINWPSSDREDRAFRDLLGTEPTQKVIMLIAVGYQDPDRLVAQSSKRTVDQMLHLNPPFQQK